MGTFFLFCLLLVEFKLHTSILQFEQSGLVTPHSFEPHSQLGQEKEDDNDDNDDDEWPRLEFKSSPL
jgi:hypothetical protein